MKLLSLNDATVFSTIEMPDFKLYTIKELKNCTTAPMFILYQHQLFILSYFHDNVGHYLAIIDKMSDASALTLSEFYFNYNFKTHKIVNHYTLEDMKLGIEPLSLPEGGINIE